MSASAPAAAPLPTAVVKLIHRISYSVHRSVDEENRYHQRLANSIGLTYTAPDTRKQEDALVAAKVAKALTEDEVYADYADLVEDVYLALDVPRSTFYKYYKLVREKTDPALRDVDLIRSVGKPRKFPLEADIALIQFIKHPDTLIIDKGMSGLARRYEQFMKDMIPLDELLLFDPEPVNEESLRVHIRALLKSLGFVFKMPKTIDVDRLHIYDALVAWWHDEEIRKLIDETDARLFFNADETSVCRIIEAAEKVVCALDEKPTIPSQMREGNHVTLFPIISASGERVTPLVILHCEREDFVNTAVYDVRTYRTANGYMDQKTFVDVMVDVFIPHVEEVRRSVKGNKHQACTAPC